jgi:hypothetical protein
MESQWSQFKLRVNIQCSVQKAYDAFATPAGWQSWFLSKCVFTGDQYEWSWYGYPDTMIERGKILSANGKDRYSFTFSQGSVVEIFIYAESGETIVELTESNFPSDPQERIKYYVADIRGWTFYLANLKAVLEKNIDLRNRKEELQDVITA